MFTSPVFWLGVLMCACGIAGTLKPLFIKTIIHVAKVSWRLRAMSAIKTAIGIVFLVFARDCRLPWVIVLLGLLIAGGSLIFLTLDAEKQLKWIQSIENKQDWFYRLMGIANLMVGILVVYAG